MLKVVGGKIDNLGVLIVSYYVFSVIYYSVSSIV
jgi:hypothetical protein